MVARRLVIEFAAVFIGATVSAGCVGSGAMCGRGWYTEPPVININGVTVEPTTETVVVGIGAPNFRIPRGEGGEMFVWRSGLQAGAKGHIDLYMAFDGEGKFVPIDRVPTEVYSYAPCDCLTPTKR